MTRKSTSGGKDTTCSRAGYAQGAIPTSFAVDSLSHGPSAAALFVYNSPL